MPLFNFQFKDLLACIITLGFFWLLYMLLSANVPTNTRDILVAMTGVCGTVFGTVAGYYYGSSSNRKEKPEQEIKKEVPVDSQDFKTP